MAALTQSNLTFSKAPFQPKKKVIELDNNNNNYYFLNCYFNLVDQKIRSALAICASFVGDSSSMGLHWVCIHIYAFSIFLFLFLSLPLSFSSSFSLSLFSFFFSHCFSYFKDI